MTTSKAPTFNKALFGAGCFWGVEEVFRILPGVVATRVGYAGGDTVDPTYEQVCTDQTGHAEVVEVTYDPSIISYQKLLTTFFSNHNPTCRNYQGPDFGSQYRSVIFTYTKEQEAVAQDVIKQEALNPRWRGQQIVTEIVPAPPFYPAEDYHQKYLMKRGLGSCHI